MAIITPSAVVSEIRGSLGTQTFSKNHHRAYVKLRKAPSRPASSYRSFATSNMSDVVAQWKSETDTVRAAWNEVAFLYTTDSRLGKKAPISGFNAYVRANMNVIYANGSFNPIPVVTGIAPRIISFTCTFLVTGIVATAIFDQTSTRYNYVIKTSGYESAGKMSFNSVPYYVNTGGTINTTTKVVSNSTFFNSRFPGLATKSGFKLFLQLYVVDTLNGVAFPSMYVSGILH